MAGRIIAIGDIHGCSAALDALTAAIAPDPADTLVFLGDYIDRGPDSRGGIDRVLALREKGRVISLTGNPELMLRHAMQVEQRDFWLDCGGRATLASYGGSLANIPPEHIAFFAHNRRWWETAEHIFVHANYVYDSPMDEQPDYAAFWEHLHSVPPPHISGKQVIVGHTPQITGEVLDMGHVVCIDTFCFGGGWLSAFNPETTETWQADAAGHLRRR